MAVNDLIKDSMRECVRDGQDLGMEMAVKALREYKDGVAAENQTWDSAIAVLELLRAKLSESRSPATEAAS